MPTSKRRMILMALDILAVLAAYVLAFEFRYGFSVPPMEAHQMLLTAAYPALAYLAASYYFGVNRGLRFYSSLGDGFDVLKAVLAAAVVQTPIVLAVGGAGFPRAVLALAPILAVFFVAGLHVLVREASHFLFIHLLGRGERRHAVIFGVCDLAELVYENMRSDQTVDYRLAAFVHDGRMGFGVRLHGAPIVDRVRLAKLLRRVQVDEIVIAVERHRRGRALDSVADALQGLARRPAVLVAPTAEEMLKSSKAAKLRKVEPADLLNRRVISLDAERISRSIQGRVVLVSGAGGTIGGELSRQAARHRPSKLILLENNATALFYTEAAVRERHPDVPLQAVLGDVRDQALLDRIFASQPPQVVFHAAAHKHVHQLETNICEGVSNNLVGTYQLARAADRAGAESFVLISTDKAVRPTCVMGATKRAAEMVVTSFARRSRTRFTSVRFGNVLGSSGSVMRIFEEQIEKGRPLTLTHPDATRYFMTVEEAVGLVLQASALANGGETFVLNMGEQIKIMDMARRLIWLSGLEPERDVAIRVVGLRPGEKIAEEIIEDPAGQEQSEHPDIMVLRSENGAVSALEERIASIERSIVRAEDDSLIRALAQLVPTFSGNGRSRDASRN